MVSSSLGGPQEDEQADVADVCQQPLDELDVVSEAVAELVTPEFVDEAGPTTALALSEPRDLARFDPLRRFLSEARRYGRLSDSEERRLGLSAQRGDSSAAEKLVLHNLRLVVMIALRYQRAWAQLSDLVQEGTVGLMDAVRRWEVSSGARFGTYASYWIRAHILQFIMTNARLVSIAHTRAGRKLFFRLEKERRKLMSEGFDATPKLLASRLDVPEDELVALSGHIEAPEASIDAPLRDDGPALADCLPNPELTPEEIVAADELRNVVGRLMLDFARTLVDERERAIWSEHLATEEPVPLANLGSRYGLSKQRMGQIADRLKKRFREALVAKFGTDARIAWLGDAPVSRRRAAEPSNPL